ncbi:hypothetical protein GO613_22910 [Azoarcus communis]|uniref:hypothetical protein n=1 Tax=Parazoarcus communis TaxID=41977 RepID=UPI001459BDE0|nr:hypothetical protein [Parazoarcus communis]NMG50941.1 hypothetical protein [Parazoarcus communis]
MLKLPLLFLALLLAGCTPRHFYTGPTDGPIATLQAQATIYEDRNGESLRESYMPTGIDGKTLRFNWKSAAIDGQYHLPPGPHKILVRASLRRGNLWDGSTKYFSVIEANFVANRHYLVNGAPRFADNRLDLWIEDSETGARVSDSPSLDLSNPVQPPTVVTYPIYVPVVKGVR